MKLGNLFCTVLLAGALAVIGCGDDGGSNGGTGGTTGTGGTGGSTGGEVCTLGICAEEGFAKTACLQAYNACVELGEQSPAQCNTVAETANCEESNL